MNPICTLCRDVAVNPVIFFRPMSGQYVQSRACQVCAEAVTVAERELPFWVDWFSRYPNEKLTINGVD